MFKVVLKRLHNLKKRFFASKIFTTWRTFFIKATQQTSELTVIDPTQASYNTIIFDLGDVLFKTPKSLQYSIFGHIILQNPSLLYHLLRIDVKKTFFNILSKIPAKTDSPIYNKGKKMPQVLNDWMTGCSTLTELNFLACNQIHNSNYPAALKNLFLKVAHFMFNAESIAQTQIPIIPMVKLLQQLQQANYKIYILSNWDPYSFTLLQEKYDELFKICDGIMISGQEQTSKPHPEFYSLLLKRYSLNANECIFIDDEPFNIAAAQKLGIRGILHTNQTTTTKELIACRIMELTV